MMMMKKKKKKKKKNAVVGLSHILPLYLGRLKQTSTFEHAQNLRIHILCMRKVSSESLRFIDTFYSTL